MYDIVNMPEQLKEDTRRIMASTNPGELIEELKTCMEMSTEYIIRMAVLVRRLEELGTPVDLDIAILPIVRRIAYGQICPEVVITFQGDPLLMEKAAALPIPDQMTVATNAPIKIMERGGDHRMVAPLSMTRREISQVFGRGKLRSESEQVGWLRERMPEPKLKAMDDGEIVIHQRRNGITVNGRFLSASDLAHYLSQLTMPRKSA